MNECQNKEESLLEKKEQNRNSPQKILGQLVNRWNDEFFETPSEKSLEKKIDNSSQASFKENGQESREL